MSTHLMVFGRPQRRWKWFTLAGVGALLAMGGGTRAVAQDISVTVDGQPVQFQDIGPQQIEGRTLVPVRGVLEKLGADVAYDSSTHTVIASTPTIDVQLKIGSKAAIVNGNSVTLDVPAQTIRDHTFVPLRFLGEALGADVTWDSATRTVHIRTKQGLQAGPPPTPEQRGPDRAPEPHGPVPIINSFVQDSPPWLRAGQAVHVALDGTPGGRASFRIPGLTDILPMREASPGHYVGEWQAPADRPLQLKSAAVIGALRVGDRMSPLIQAGQPLSVDAIPPQIRDTAPDNGANVNDPRPSISAAFDDQGSGVDPRSVHLLVDGRDVTPDATVTRDFVSYRPSTPLPPGPQALEVQVSDEAGNHSGAHWSFVEANRGAEGIRSVSDSVTGPLQPGDTIHVEMAASPGGQASFSVGNIRDVPMREREPGHYTADYTPRKNDDTAAKPITFVLKSADGQRFEQSSSNVIHIRPGKPAPPAITSPGPSQPPSNPLIVHGKAYPGARVHVRIDYRDRALGVVLKGTAADSVVTADGNGDWKTAPIGIGGLFGRRIEYTISATAINGAGETSDTASTQFEMR